MGRLINSVGHGQYVLCYAMLCYIAYLCIILLLLPQLITAHHSSSQLQYISSTSLVGSSYSARFRVLLGQS